MREKELRLALVCYGGISLAVYMHGVTKEVWHLVRASRAYLDGDTPPPGGSIHAYRALLGAIEAQSGTRLRVLTDIIAGASAGGINGVFLARAITHGQSLEPLTGLWLDKADVTVLLDPDARPGWRFSKWWAVPLAWLVSRTPRNTIDTTVERSARSEVRRKLSQFVRARWFAPPFGGELFSNLLLDALEAMGKGIAGPKLLPAEQPLDLIVTATDLGGHPQRMRLNSPAEVQETEHRLLLRFRHATGMADDIGDIAGLTFAARATASFPGAFPPFAVAELDAVLAQRQTVWPQRAAFLEWLFGDGRSGNPVESRWLVDGSVLANAPFKPAIAALRQRPARREVDRRFVYIDPKPGRRSISVGGGGGQRERAPGFFGTIFRTLSDIPRAQPIRDNVEAIEAMSQRIRRMSMIIAAMRPEVEARIETALGRTFFLDRPTVQRLGAWRAAAHAKASAEAGFSFVAYSHLKLSLIVEEMAVIAAACSSDKSADRHQQWRTALWQTVRDRQLDKLDGRNARRDDVVRFFREHDVAFRIRRLRHMARCLEELMVSGAVEEQANQVMRAAIYESLGLYFDRESHDHYAGLDSGSVPNESIAGFVDALALRRNLIGVDALADERLAEALCELPKEARRELVLAYLGFAFYDAATLPLLHADSEGEFDAIKIDRISPDDATMIREGGVEATLKGIQFNSFGAFFSRAFRENDYLWGRLHAAERLIAIVASAAPVGQDLPADVIRSLQRDAFRAILDEEAARLTAVPGLIDEIRAELG
jgi:patatin-related protein